MHQPVEGLLSFVKGAAVVSKLIVTALVEVFISCQGILYFFQKRYEALPTRLSIPSPHFPPPSSFKYTCLVSNKLGVVPASCRTLHTHSYCNANCLDRSSSLGELHLSATGCFPILVVLS